MHGKGLLHVEVFGSGLVSRTALAWLYTDWCSLSRLHSRNITVSCVRSPFQGIAPPALVAAVDGVVRSASLRVGGPADAAVMVNSADGGACPHEDPAYGLPSTASRRPTVHESEIRFSYTAHQQYLTGDRPFFMNYQSKGGFTAFLHFQLQGDQSTQPADHVLLFCGGGSHHLSMVVTQTGLLKVKAKTASGTVESRSTTAVGDGTDELFAVHYVPSAATVMLYRGSSAANVTLPWQQVRSLQAGQTCTGYVY